eukprot:TRINITY_DN1110_c0_g4_i1.p2 TRINITY_DN1110_c0_g4~~TRINITY_DN1110_c0_g4_i1.p2  ORF type:complete len:133 (-),score=26.30 TRINITY_DN1110_c0_g4_i1:1079-1477(-)
MLRVDSSQRPNCKQILEAIGKIEVASSMSATPIRKTPRSKSKIIQKKQRKKSSYKRCIFMAGAIVFIAAIVIGIFFLDITAYKDDCVLYEQNAQSIPSLILVVRKKIDENEEYIGDIVNDKREGNGRGKVCA